MNVIVIWQSLVVSAYRSFWSHLARRIRGSLTAVIPHEFWELGGQTVTCAPFSDDWKNTVETHVLRVHAPHVQAVWFHGLAKVFRTAKRALVQQNTSRTVLVALMEPYSPSALFVYVLAQFFLPRKTLILFYSLQNIYKEFPLPLKLIQKFIFNRSPYILSLSEEVTGVLRRQGYAGDIIRFPLWADSSLFNLNQASSKDPDLANHLRARIGYCGAVTESKGVPDLLAALELLSDAELAQIHFEIAGGGPYLDEARSRLAALGRRSLTFTLHGPLPATELPDFFNSIDVLVVPSRTESHWKEQFGRVIVEAWACGASVIGSTSGEIPVLLCEPALIFEERNPESLLSVLRGVVAKGFSIAQRQRNAERAQPYLDVTLARQFAENLERIIPQD